MKGSSFSFVEDPLNREYSRLNPICRPTFMKYLQLATKEVEKVITEILPKTLD